MQRKSFPLFFPFQKYLLYELQKTNKLINSVETKHFQTNKIYTYLHRKLGKMILTVFAVYTNIHLWSSHL